MWILIHSEELNNSGNVKHGGDPLSTYAWIWIEGRKSGKHTHSCAVSAGNVGENGQDLTVFLLAYEMDDPRFAEKGLNLAQGLSNFFSSNWHFTPVH